MADQATENYATYRANYKVEMEQEHFGKTALMHNGEIVYVFNSCDDAYMVGVGEYGLGAFSLVRIGQKPIRLSWRGMGYKVAV